MILLSLKLQIWQGFSWHHLFWYCGSLLSILKSLALNSLNTCTKNTYEIIMHPVCNIWRRVIRSIAGIFSEIHKKQNTSNLHILLNIILEKYIHSTSEIHVSLWNTTFECFWQIKEVHILLEKLPILYSIALILNRKIHLKNGTSSLVQSSLQPFNTIMNI